MKDTSAKNPWPVGGAAIVLPPGAAPIARGAAAELARYLYLLTGKTSAIVNRLPARGPFVLLDRKLAAALGVPVTLEQVGDQGYRLAAGRRGRQRFVAIAATQPVGVLYGVFGLLEQLGMGFYAGGDTFPELPAPAAVPADLDRCDRPAFAVRGNLLHYNFLCGCTDWGLGDYKFYFDQLAHLRGNVLLMHWYDHEPGAAHQVEGEYLTGGITPNSLTKPWGALAALRTSEFSFGTGRFFDEEIFSSPMGEDLPDLLTEIKRTEAVFREATRYARSLGVRVAAGFEAPRGNPTDPPTIARFQARVRQFLERNPDLGYFALWQHESGGCVGTEPPAAGTTAAALFAAQRKQFDYLGNDQRVWEAIRFGRFAQLALAVMAQETPRLPLVLVGWGGDRWMQFADYCLGYDRLLPAHVIFTCHDNIDASMGPNVSTPWGQLPPERERWALPWVEGDIDECAVRQPHVESLGKLAPDALRKGCQGLLTMQWRTRDVEEETGYAIRFAWNTALTPAAFYRELARHAFGPDQEVRMGQRLATLQRLGARWTGVRGAGECSAMRWTGWTPHFPFELDERVPAYLVPKVEKTIAALAEVPSQRDSEAAFHLLPQQDQSAAAPTDPTRLGVQEMQQVLERLRHLAGERDPDRLRTELIAIEEAVYELRPRLVAYGMSSKSYQALDSFLIAIHHLQRNAGATAHRPVLERLRRELATLRACYVNQQRPARLERLDYLDATIEFALRFDGAVMLLADGERIDQALAAAETARAAGDPAGAATTAAAAYHDLLATGLQQALLAFTRKLTTRCDWGTLTTLNVKPLPLYWQTIERLEAFLPAVPPRELAARGQPREVWLSWQPSGRVTGQNLYRRRSAGGAWKRINRQPLAADCRMFRDQPARPGEYDYAVTALAKDGWESPRSHSARAACGPARRGPRLVASKPFGRLAAGEDLRLRVVALDDHGIADVTICYRAAGARAWQQERMVHRFRDSYVGAVPAARLAGATVEFYIAATNRAGRRAVWPASAPGLPWSVARLGAK